MSTVAWFFVIIFHNSLLRFTRQMAALGRHLRRHSYCAHSCLLCELLAGTLLEYTDGNCRRDGQWLRHVQEDQLPTADTCRTQFKLTLRIHHLYSPVVWVSYEHSWQHYYLRSPSSFTILFTVVDKCI